MIAVLALAAATAAPPGPLQAAETAFAQGDYQRADALATAAAEPPQQGAALYLAALETDVRLEIGDEVGFVGLRRGSRADRDLAGALR